MLMMRGFLTHDKQADHQELRDVLAEWASAGWEAAAQYHFQTFGYEFEIYEQDGTSQEDARRMRGYATEQPDTDRGKSYAGAAIEVLALPSPTADLAPEPAVGRCGSAQPLSSDKLLQILSLLACPVREKRLPWSGAEPVLLKTSPSGGSRHPTEIYLWVTGLDGLNDGWWHVAAHEHRLERIGGAAPPFELIAPLPGQVSAGPRVLLLYTCLFARNRYRYREPRTFRTVHMDVGHLMGTCEFLATSRCLDAAPVTHIDAPALAAALALNPLVECPIAATMLRQSSPANAWLQPSDEGDNRLAMVRFDAYGDVVFEDAQRGLKQHIDPHSAMNSILKMSPETAPRQEQDVVSDWISKGWRPSLEYFLWSELPSRSYPRPGSAAAHARWQELPHPTRDRLVPSVGALLVGRRTVRVFDRRPLASADLAGIVELPGIYLGAGVSFRLVAYDVDGLSPGVWTIDERRRRAHLGVAGEFREEMSAIMCGMSAARTASLTLVLVVDMQQRQRAYPYERALRELYVDLGRLSQHLIIAAEALGLGCLITPATNDRKLAALLRLEHRECPVYTLTIGHKLSEHSEE
jgi:SagB-type dehydrogenase family enzyme